MKILFWNLWYARWYNWPSDHFKYPHRLLGTSERVVDTVLSQVERLIQKEQPDVCGFVEVQSRFLFGKHFAHCARKEFFTKYGESSFAGNISFLRWNWNAVLCKEDTWKIKDIYLSHGVKKLLIEVTKAHWVTILVWHFSLRPYPKTSSIIPNIRKKQFEEIIVKYSHTKENLIIAWDFNIFEWMKELEYLCQELDLEIVHAGPTYPSQKPQKILDLFLVSKKILDEANNVTVRAVKDEYMSDHLPIILDIDISNNDMSK